MSFATIKVAPREDQKIDTNNREESDERQVNTCLLDQDEEETEYRRIQNSKQQHRSFSAIAEEHHIAVVLASILAEIFDRGQVFELGLVSNTNPILFADVFINSHGRRVKRVAAVLLTT